MMVKRSKEELEIYDTIFPWLILDESGDTYLNPDAPTDIKEQYGKWMTKFVIPARDASERGAIIY